MNQRAPALPRVVYVAVALVVLLGVVAFASRGHTPAAGDVVGTEPRAPVQALFDIVFTLAFVAGIALLVFVAFARASATTRRRQVSFRSILVITAVVAGFIALAIAFGDRFSNKNRNILNAPGQLASAGDAAGKRAQEPEFQWPIALGTVAILVAGLGVLIVRERRKRRGGAIERALAERLADVLDETLDDLRAEPDPRRAVIAAYARMERALAMHGLPRREAEAPLEYLARVLRELEASEPAVRALTDLFAVAKFSDHQIDSAMKEEAILALESVRDDLRAVGLEGPPPLEHAPPTYETAR